MATEEAGTRAECNMFYTLRIYGSAAVWVVAGLVGRTHRSAAHRYSLHVSDTGRSGDELYKQASMYIYDELRCRCLRLFDRDQQTGPDPSQSSMA